MFLLCICKALWRPALHEQCYENTVYKVYLIISSHCAVNITGAFWKKYFSCFNIPAWWFCVNGFRFPHSSVWTGHLSSLHWQQNTIWLNMSRTPGSSSLFCTIRNSEPSPWVVRVFSCDERSPSLFTLSIKQFCCWRKRATCSGLEAETRRVNFK